MKTHSPLTASQWRNLEAIASQAAGALSDLRFALVLHCQVERDPDLMAALLEKAVEAKRTYDLIATMSHSLHLRTDWIGGDVTDPDNHVLREPLLMGLRRLTVLET